MIHSPIQSKPRCITSTEFTFCNLININNNNENFTKDENNFVFSPSFKPTSVYSGYNCSSPTTKARNKILEMMNNLLESCHELSLKDIVVDDLKDIQTMVKQTSFRGKNIRRKRPISRSVSLDTGVFMLKMFVPSSFGTKKSRSSSRMCSSTNSFSNKDSKQTSNKSYTNCTSTNNTQSRFSELTPRFWFINKPWKQLRQRGCIF